jgi:hypothetical protein
LTKFNDLWQTGNFLILVLLFEKVNLTNMARVLLTFESIHFGKESDSDSINQ